MKKFFFRLETLLKVRSVREGSMKRELEYARQRWGQGQEKQKMLQAQILALTEEMHRSRTGGKQHLQETYSQILEHLNTALSSLQHNLSAQQKQIEEQQERLRQAVQERKVIEKIKEKHYSGWRDKQMQTEGTLLDEITLSNSARVD